MNDSNRNNEFIEEEKKQDEIKEPKKRGMSDKAIVLLVLFITLIGMLAFGLSVSVFNGTLPSDDNLINNIIAGRDDDDDDGKLVFSYYDKPGIGNGIWLKNQFPTPDAVGKAFKGENYVFDFKLLLNEKSAGIRYTIVAEKLVNSDLRNDLVKLYLESDGRAVSNVVRDDGSIKNFTEYSDYRKKVTQKVLYTGTITRAEASRGYKNFTFKMWLSDELPMLDDDYGRTFLTRINVHASGDL